MSKTYRAIRGTRDLLPGEIERWSFLERIVRAAMIRFGYEEIRTPVFEQTELFTRSIGTDTDIVQKEMYTFLDRKGRSLTLRPEGTAPVCRAYLENNVGRERPVAKLFYMGPMFRYERPQKGRQRQFHQFGTELIGSADPRHDAESICLFYDILRDLGFHGLSVKLGSVGDADCRPSYVAELSAYFERHTDRLTDAEKERLERNPLRLLDSKNPSIAELIAGAPPIFDFLSDRCQDHLNTVQAALDRADVRYVLDSGMVRGLDYYTDTVFEIHSDELGAQSALGGGGRYDRLIEELGGPSTPGVGFAAGMERIVIAGESLELDWTESVGVKLFVAPLAAEAEEAVFPILHKLRRRWAAEGSFTAKNLKTLLKHANRAGADLLLLIGEDELATRSVSVKNMETGEQTTLPAEDIEQGIKTVVDTVTRRPAEEK